MRWSIAMFMVVTGSAFIFLTVHPLARAQRTPVVPEGQTPDSYKAELAQQAEKAKQQRKGGGFEYKCTNEVVAKLSAVDKIQDLANRYN